MTSSAIDCDVISITKTKRVRHGDDVYNSLFVWSFMDSLCRVRNKIMYVLSWRTVSALTRVLFWFLFPSLLRNSGNKHQNNPLVSAETIRHSSAYIILYIHATEIAVWIIDNNTLFCVGCNFSSMPNLQLLFTWIAVKVRPWMSN